MYNIGQLDFTIYIFLIYLISSTRLFHEEIFNKSSAYNHECSLKISISCTSVLQFYSTKVKSAEEIRCLEIFQDLLSHPQYKGKFLGGKE